MPKNDTLLSRKSKQKEGIVLATASEGDLQRPDFFRMIGCKVHLGRPEKKGSTLDHIVILDLPKERTSFEVLNRLQEIKIGILTPHPISGASKLVKLSQEAPVKKPFSVLVSYEDKVIWENLNKIKPELIIFRLKNSSVEEAKEFFGFLKQQKISAPIILYLILEKGEKVQEAYYHLLSAFPKKGLWIDSSEDLETKRHQASFVKE